MPQTNEELIQQLTETIRELTKTNREQAQTITDLRANIEMLLGTINNLNEMLAELRRKLFGKSSEKSPAETAAEKAQTAGKEDTEEKEPVTVKGHTRNRGKRSPREELYEKLPIEEVKCDVPEGERLCPDCGTPMERLGYAYAREELRITPARVVRVRYLQEKLVCPVCKEEGDTTIVRAKTPAPLMPHSPASPDMVAEVMYQKMFMDVPFYRQEKDWLQKGVPIPRGTAARWFNFCGLEYFLPVYEVMHEELATHRDILHVDEVPCQVLKEEGREAEKKSYMWIYSSGTDGKPKIILYDYRPGRSGDHPIEFLKGFSGTVHCDGYQAYGRLEDVILVCCLAHCRRKFYEAIPAERRKKIKLLDINSDTAIQEPEWEQADDTKMLSAEKGVAFCNRIFFLERIYKELPSEKRKEERLKKEPEIWVQFWAWLDTLTPTGGSKLEKAVNYALNHKDSLMAYLSDGRCEVSNNAAERLAKSYVMARKNFLFHDTVDGARASAVVLSLVETAKANNLNIYMYLYTLLLYMPDYKNEPAGVEQLLPWSEFIRERCSGITDIESYRPELKGNLPLTDSQS